MKIQTVAKWVPELHDVVQVIQLLDNYNNINYTLSKMPDKNCAYT